MRFLSSSSSSSSSSASSSVLAALRSTSKSTFAFVNNNNNNNNNNDNRCAESEDYTDHDHITSLTNSSARVKSHKRIETSKKSFPMAGEQSAVERARRFELTVCDARRGLRVVVGCIADLSARVRPDQEGRPHSDSRIPLQGATRQFPSSSSRERKKSDEREKKAKNLFFFLFFFFFALQSCFTFTLWFALIERTV
jgi:hypothetical protein